MLSKIVFLGFLIFCALFSQVASAQEIQTSSFKSQSSIGVILPLTGSFERYGAKIKSVMMSGNTCQAKFIFEDESCDPQKSLTSYKKLTAIDRINIFLGPFCGSPQLVVAQQIKNKNQFALLASSAPEAVFEQSNKKMFSVQHSIEAEARKMANYLNQKEITSVAITYLDNFFSQSHEKEFREHFKGKILDTITYTAEDLTQIKNIALKLKKLKPSALYVPDAFPIMHGLTQQLNATGLENLPIYSVYTAQSQDVLAIIDQTQIELTYTYPNINAEDVLDFLPKIASQVLCRALEACNDNPECVRKRFLEDPNFNQFGIMETDFILKKRHQGKLEILPMQ